MVGGKEEANESGLVLTSNFTPPMPIPEPAQKPSDLFHIVGFTEAEVKSGAVSRALGISEEGFRTVAALGRKGSPLWEAAQIDRVEKRLNEVYFLDVRSSPRATLPDVHGKDFRLLHFYNDTAREIVKALSLDLPPIVSSVVRAELPANLSVGVRDYYYAVLEPNSGPTGTDQ